MSKNLDKSELFPYLHPQNIREIHMAVKHRKAGVWVHGDGHIYPKEDATQKSSLDRKVFRNTDQEHPATFGGGYRVFYDQESTLPRNISELEAHLQAATSAERAVPETQANSGRNPLALPAFTDDDDEFDEFGNFKSDAGASGSELLKQRLADITGGGEGTGTGGPELTPGEDEKKKTGKGKTKE